MYQTFYHKITKNSRWEQDTNNSQNDSQPSYHWVSNGQTQWNAGNTFTLQAGPQEQDINKASTCHSSTVQQEMW